ncbi:hypothetical protein KGM48_00285 [Patescibacteria group bacterium]|nr:hypothetical protein [Patescibacteria group bacterium]
MEEMVYLDRKPDCPEGYRIFQNILSHPWKWNKDELRLFQHPGQICAEVEMCEFQNALVKRRRPLGAVLVEWLFEHPLSFPYSEWNGKRILAAGTIFRDRTNHSYFEYVEVLSNRLVKGLHWGGNRFGLRDVAIVWRS